MRAEDHTPGPTSRSDTLATLRRLAGGLAPGGQGAGRLLERIAATDDAERLRAVLTERGAGALLEDLVAPRPTDPMDAPDPMDGRAQ